MHGVAGSVDRRAGRNMLMTARIKETDTLFVAERNANYLHTRM